MHKKLAYLLLKYSPEEVRGDIGLIIYKKKVFYALFCALLMTSSAYGSALDQEVIQILRRVLQRMAPEEMVQIEREGLSGWQRVTINALTQAIKNDIPRTELYDSILAQLKSPDEISKLMRAYPDLVSDLKPGLKESIERLMLEGRGEVEASVRNRVVGMPVRGVNRLQALVEPAEDEMAVLTGVAKAEEGAVATVASSSQEAALPQFLDRTFLQGAAFTESLIPEAEREVLFYATFPEFKISRELLKSRPQEWIALLIEHGEFKLTRSAVMERGTQYVLKSAHAGGVEMTILSTSFNGDIHFTAIDLCYLFKEEGIEALVSYRHHLTYLDDHIGSWVIMRNGESIFERVYR